MAEKGKNNHFKEKVKDQFGRNAEKYVTSATHAKGDDLSLMIEWLNPQKHWWALDVATGGGHVTKHISPHVHHVCSTDLTLKMLETAREHLVQLCPNVTYVEADAEKLPFLDHSFDVVICRIAAHHFPNPSMFLQEAARVLKNGGKLLLIDNIAPSEEKLDMYINTIEKLRDDSHVRCYQMKEWETWAKEAGLTIEKSRTRKKTFDFPTWVRRTTTSEEQIKKVEEHILQGSKEMQAYCGLVMKEDEISSIQIDEWMVLFMKN